MLSKPLAFEQDKNAIFLRNQEMHLHFSKLDSIKQRKNIYLPEIPISRRLLRLQKNYSSPSILRDRQYFINRDNQLIYQKLHKINQRANQISNDSEIIDEYLNIKKYTMDKTRELKKSLLQKENEKFKERITHTRSVIDNRSLDNQFKKLKKISGYLRRVQPQGTVGDIYLNRKESQIIRKYERDKADFYSKTKFRESTMRRRNLNASVDDSHLTGVVVDGIIRAFSKHHTSCRHHNRALWDVGLPERDAIVRRAAELSYKLIFILLGNLLCHGLR